jgi:hypothetical protein
MEAKLESTPGQRKIDRVSYWLLLLAIAAVWWVGAWTTISWLVR